MGQRKPVGAALSDAFLSAIYQASSDEARRLSLALTETDRARLAIFCNGKAHLRGHGRAIATACAPDSLIQVGGTAGRILLDQASAAPDRWGAASQAVKQISLGGGNWLDARSASPR